MNLVFLVCDEHTHFVFGAFSTKQLAKQAIDKLKGLDLYIKETTLDVPLIKE